MSDEIKDQLMEVMKLRRKFKLYEIAALLVNINPSDLSFIRYGDESDKGFWALIDTDMPYIVNKETGKKKLNYLPKNELFEEISKVMIDAVNAEELTAFDPNNWIDRAREDHFRSTGNWDYLHGNDNTELWYEDVKNWVQEKGFKTDFFPNQSAVKGLPSYLDKNNPEHSLELGIAIEAWQRFSDFELSHPKDYIKKWLEENYRQTISQKAIDRITTLVNWNASGGTKTSAFKQNIYDQALQKNLNQK